MGPELPTVAAYLERLPGGADAYPGCTVKASPLRAALEDRPLGPEVPLPAPVRALVDAPPPVSSWIPEVHFNTSMLAIRDVHFGGRGEEAFLTWVYHQNRKILSAPLYRALFLVLSPERLLLGAERRWGAFRRGSELRHVSLGSRDVEVTLVTPPHLYESLSRIALGSAFRAALEGCGARTVGVDVEARSPTEVRYRLRWS